MTSSCNHLHKLQFTEIKKDVRPIWFFRSISAKSRYMILYIRQNKNQYKFNYVITNDVITSISLHWYHWNSQTRNSGFARNVKVKSWSSLIDSDLRWSDLIESDLQVSDRNLENFGKRFWWNVGPLSRFKSEKISFPFRFMFIHVHS